MTSAKAVSRRFLALGVVVGALATATILALAGAWDAPGTEGEPAAQREEDGHAGAMDSGWRCQHMPEHCADPNESHERPGGAASWA